MDRSVPKLRIFTVSSKALPVEMFVLRSPLFRINENFPSAKNYYSDATVTRFAIYSVSFPVAVRKLLLSLKICMKPVPSPVAI